MRHPTERSSRSQFDQLSQVERIEIYRWHASGESARWIGEALGRHHSTISRELARNSKDSKQWTQGYEPVRAHSLALRRRQWDCRFKPACSMVTPMDTPTFDWAVPTTNGL